MSPRCLKILLTTRGIETLTIYSAGKKAALTLINRQQSNAGGGGVVLTQCD